MPSSAEERARTSICRVKRRDASERRARVCISITSNVREDTATKET